MTDLSLTSQPNSADKQQSLFKLPIIFAVIMTFCSIFEFIFHMVLYVDFDFWVSSRWSLYYDSAYVFNTIFCRVLYFFVIALIMTIGQNTHRTTSGNIVALFIICVIYTISTIFVSSFVPKGFLSFIQFFTDNLPSVFFEWYSSFESVFYIILDITYLLILVVLFKLMGIVYNKDRDVYSLPDTTNNKLFAFLFALILCFPTILMSYWIQSFISALLTSYFDQIFNFKDASVLFTIFASSLPVLITFAIIFINLTLCYFIAKGCFVRKFDRIPLKLLFKSAGWAYLYVLIFSIVLSLIQFFVTLMLLMSVNRHSYSQMESMAVFALIISFVFCIIAIVGIIKLIRKAVRKYFGEASIL